MQVIHITKPVSMTKADALDYFKEIISFLKNKGIKTMLASRKDTKMKWIVREPDEQDLEHFKSYLTFAKYNDFQPLYISEIQAGVRLEVL